MLFTPAGELARPVLGKPTGDAAGEHGLEGGKPRRSRGGWEHLDSYVNNNPLSYVDPFGFMGEDSRAKTSYGMNGGPSGGWGPSTTYYPPSYVRVSYTDAAIGGAAGYAPASLCILFSR